MQVLLLIAGLILLLVNPPLFAAAGTVGWICLGVFAGLTLLQIIAFSAVRSKQKEMFGRDPFSRL